MHPAYTDFKKCAGFEVDSNGNISLCGKTFADQEFSGIVFVPPKEMRQTLLVKDCRFVNCFGRLAVYSGAILRNVVFENLRIGMLMEVSADAILDRVTFKGKHRSYGLWVKPDYGCNDAEMAQISVYRQRVQEAMSQIDYMLDIRDYDAPQIEINGLPASKVLINPEKHVVVKAEWQNIINWNQDGFSPNSFWKSRVGYLIRDNLNDAVYGLPHKKNRHYEETMAEFAILKRMRLV